MNEVCAPELLADSGRGNPSNVALAERDLRIARDFLFECVGSKRGEQCAAARQYAKHRSQRGSAQDGRVGVQELFLARHQLADLAGEDFALVLVLEIDDDLGKAEHAHRDRHEADPVGQFRNVEAKARNAGIDVGTDQPEQQAEHDHRDGLDQRARCQHDRTDQAEHHQRKVFRRPELERELDHR